MKNPGSVTFITGRRGEYGEEMRWIKKEYMKYDEE